MGAEGLAALCKEGEQATGTLRGVGGGGLGGLIGFGLVWLVWGDLGKVEGAWLCLLATRKRRGQGSF